MDSSILVQRVSVTGYTGETKFWCSNSLWLVYKKNIITVGMSKIYDRPKMAFTRVLIYERDSRISLSVLDYSMKLYSQVMAIFFVNVIWYFECLYFRLSGVLFMTEFVSYEIVKVAICGWFNPGVISPP